jgi:myosin-5
MKMSKGLRVWVKDQVDVWISGIVLSDEGANGLSIQMENGRQFITQETPLLRNPDILMGTNDLTSLSYLHEPAVLQSLQIRYRHSMEIYTYCGIVLVAVNPYQSLPLYGCEIIRAYNESQVVRGLDPHVYAVAEEAYQLMKMERGNQSIIVSGESGAGKTVNAKHVLRYFASVNSDVGEADIERKVLLTNPILEALGNAKTTRNDNSSRFGKYIEVCFSKKLGLLGAQIRTYLLEKTRVITQSADERNYHVFYQLVASRDRSEIKDLELASPDYFYYLNQGDCPVIVGVDDVNEFQMLLNALELLHFNDSDQWNMFKLLVAILHLGNLKINESMDICSCSKSGTSLEQTSNLLGISSASLDQWLCHKKIRTAHETLIKPLTLSESTTSRDSLAKHLYDHLFAWVVEKINISLRPSAVPDSFIGVLDIYGFEVFQVNSFEQFCINYANEKLQQQFNMHVFKLEQEEYTREGITWSYIDYSDNQPCIDLIEGHLGIVDMLNETCKMPGCSDVMFAEKLYGQILKPGHSHFSKPRTSRTAFCIHHYADIVTYQVLDFTAKNKDSLYPEHLQLLQSSQNAFISELFVNERLHEKQKGIKTSVSSKFKESLTGLMSKLNQTTPHYIRCIKPNDTKSPLKFNRTRVAEQLRACGVLETIRISAAGFPSRCSYDDFFDRYRMLLPWQQVRRNDQVLMCRYILQRCIKDEEKYRLGNTKIFFRAGQVAHMEALRSDLLHRSCLKIQTHYRMWSQYNRYKLILATAKMLQCYVRGLLARRKVQKLREHLAAAKIQSIYKMHVAREEYMRIKGAVLRIQSFYRGMRARRLVDYVRQCKAALMIQRVWRSTLARLVSKRRKRNIIKVQCIARVWLARRRLRELKIEAKSVDHLQTLNKGLELKIITLQQKLTREETKNAQILAENKALRAKNEELVGYRVQVIELEKEMKEMKESSTQLFEERNKNEMLLKDLSNIKKSNEETKQLHQKEMNICNELCYKLNAKLDEAQRQRENCPSLEEWNMLKQEYILLEQHHQDSLADQHNTSLHRKSLMDIDIMTNDGDLSLIGSPPNPDRYTRSLSLSIVPSEIKKWSQSQSINQPKGLISIDEDDLDKHSSLIRSLQDEINRLTEENTSLKKKLASLEDKSNTSLEEIVYYSLTPKASRQGPSLTRCFSTPKPVMGMLSWQLSDIPKIMKHVITDGDLRSSGVPCLEAHVLFMCVRYSDHCSLVDNTTEFIENILTSIQYIYTTFKDDLSMLSYWLANLTRFLHNARQYSGSSLYENPLESMYRASQTCLTSFDLSEYHHAITDEGVVLYQLIVQLIENILRPMIVPGLIEHQGMPGIANVRPAGWLKALRIVSKPMMNATPGDIERELNSVLSILESCYVEPDLIGQIFKQIFYTINAVMMNYLLLRKDLCNWVCGIQMRYNLNFLEEWIREHGLAPFGVLDALQPIVQASKLLQMKKQTIADAETICNTCTELNLLQIQKLLSMYTPSVDYEQRVPAAVINHIVEECSHKVRTGHLMTDEGYSFPVLFHYIPTDVNFATITVPRGLDFLIKI